jgi:hypothetical protein
MKKYSAIIYMILAGGIFFTFVDPQYKEIKVLQEDQVENEQLLQKANELRRKRQELSDKYAAISESEKQQLLKVLPDTVDNVRLILDMTNIADNANTNYGIILNGVSISGDLDELSGQRGVASNSNVIDNSANKFGVINVRFSFSAPYETFKMFMRDLENSLRVVDIRDFSVNASGVSDVYNYSISLDTYWLR